MGPGQEQLGQEHPGCLRSFLQGSLVLRIPTNSHNVLPYLQIGLLISAQRLIAIFMENRIRAAIKERHSNEHGDTNVVQKDTSL